MNGLRTATQHRLHRHLQGGWHVPQRNCRPKPYLIGDVQGSLPGKSKLQLIKVVLRQQVLTGQGPDSNTVVFVWVTALCGWLFGLPDNAEWIFSWCERGQNFSHDKLMMPTVGARLAGLLKEDPTIRKSTWLRKCRTHNWSSLGHIL